MINHWEMRLFLSDFKNWERTRGHTHTTTCARTWHLPGERLSPIEHDKFLPPRSPEDGSRLRFKRRLDVVLVYKP